VVFVAMDECLSHIQQLLCFSDILSTSSQKIDSFDEHLDDVKNLQPENSERTAEYKIDFVYDIEIYIVLN
jgi:hypothetical protein